MVSKIQWLCSFNQFQNAVMHFFQIFKIHRWNSQSHTYGPCSQNTGIPRIMISIYKYETNVFSVFSLQFHDHLFLSIHNNVKLRKRWKNCIMLNICLNIFKRNVEINLEKKIFISRHLSLNKALQTTLEYL